MESTTPPTNQPSTPAVPAKRSSVNYLFAFVMLIIGVFFGYVLFALLPAAIQIVGPQNKPVEKQQDISLPRDAQRIQVCSDHRGSLYVKPQDIPVGPIYMVYNGKVIGLEFMLAQDEFIAGKAYKYLSGLGMKVDHVNSGLLAHGHAGYVKPHYHIDLYSVSKSVEDAITCGDNNEEMNMDMNMDASPSAKPVSVSPTMMLQNNDMKMNSTMP